MLLFTFSHAWLVLQICNLYNIIAPYIIFSWTHDLQILLHFHMC